MHKLPWSWDKKFREGFEREEGINTLDETYSGQRGDS